MIHFFFNLLFSYYRNHTQYISSFLSISPGEMNTVKDQPNSKDVRIFAAKARDGTKNTLHVRHTPFCDGSHYLSIMQMAEQEIVMQLFFFVFRMLQTWPLITHTGLQKRADQDMLLQTARASWRIKKSLQVLCSMLRRLWQTNANFYSNSFIYVHVRRYCCRGSNRSDSSCCTGSSIYLQMAEERSRIHSGPVEGFRWLSLTKEGSGYYLNVHMIENSHTNVWFVRQMFPWSHGPVLGPWTFTSGPLGNWKLNNNDIIS